MSLLFANCFFYGFLDTLDTLIKQLDCTCAHTPKGITFNCELLCSQFPSLLSSLLSTPPSTRTNGASMLYVALCTLLAELCESSLAALYLDQLVLPDELLAVLLLTFCSASHNATQR